MDDLEDPVELVTNALNAGLLVRLGGWYYRLVQPVPGSEAEKPYLGFSRKINGPVLPSVLTINLASDLALLLSETELNLIAFELKKRENGFERQPARP